MAKKRNVYIALIEVKPLKGCELDPEQIQGAAVRCYIPAETEEQARESLFENLRRDCFELMEIEFLIHNDAPGWKRRDDSVDLDGVRDALEKNEMVYSSFYSWRHEVPDK